MDQINTRILLDEPNLQNHCFWLRNAKFQKTKIFLTVEWGETVRYFGSRWMGFKNSILFFSKLLSKIWIFIWNLLRGTWKGFSFDVYMPFITIFITIKQPFAWHIYFLVRHLRRYSDLQQSLVTSFKHFKSHIF